MLNIKEGTKIFYAKDNGFSKAAGIRVYTVESGILGRIYCRLGTETWYKIGEETVSETCIILTYNEAIEKINTMIELEIKDCEKQIAKLKESIKTYKKEMTNLKNNNR